MCGIFGIKSLNSDFTIDESLFYQSLMKMEHRGPDFNGYNRIDDNTIFGHVRLSIIDLRPESNQPMLIDNRFWIVFNGEIYNYIELRDELIKEVNFNFHTESDTEVLLRAYQYWGENCVQKFNGMWAFTIYDTLEDKIFCSRDRFGVKPFNYSLVDNVFIFSSEIKSIINYFPQLKEPNYNVIANYCRTSTGAQIKETWFRNVFRLQPGHNLVIKDNKISEYRYWTYPTKINRKISLEEATKIYKDLFIDAVRLRMRSDVPVGTTLSSGLDSGSIVSVLRTFYNNEHLTFTARFNPDNYNKGDKSMYASSNLEINEAEIVKNEAEDLNLTPTFIDIRYGDFVSELKNIIYYLESGNSSPATFPLMQVMEEARKKVTVVLEGQGADELLLGYLNPNFVLIVQSLLKKLKFNPVISLFREFKAVYSVKYAFLLYIRGLLNISPFLRRFFKFVDSNERIYGKNLKKYDFIKDYPDLTACSEDEINTQLIKQHSGGLVNLLHYGDAISMANSLESRLPFMDYRIVEFVFSLPWSYKSHNTMTKYLHRLAMENIVPDFILNNKVKFGFTTPISDKFSYSNGIMSNTVEILLSDRCISRNLFKKDELVKLITDHNIGKKYNGTLLFRLLSVELWFREFID